MTSFVSSVMALIYTGISAVLLFWHAAWERLLGGAGGFSTDWAWVLGIVFLVVTVRIVLFPLFVKQTKSQRALQMLHPKVKQLQERHKDDRETLQRELMKLYRSEKVNPLASLVPILVQAPVFFGLFHVLRHLRPTITSETSRTLYGWTLHQFESASQATLFSAPIAASFQSSAAETAATGANGITVQLVSATLIAIMVLTTFLSGRQMILKTGWSDDPPQRIVQRLMLYGLPLTLTISGLLFPIGVVIYWTVQNIISLGQQMWILRKYPPPVRAIGSEDPAHEAATR